MKKYLLTIVTEDQSQIENAEKTAEFVGRTINSKNSAQISEYYKFPHSYKIEFTEDVPANADSLRFAVELAGNIASPWLIWYYPEEGEPELIFNKADHVKYSQKELDVIKWANLTIIST